MNWPEADSICGVSDEQRRAYWWSRNGQSIGIIGGGPGTGKTYLLAAILAACKRDGLGPIAVCAPTGKAAIRITQSLQKLGVGFEATTIHRLLVVTDIDNGEGWSFHYGEAESLPHRLIAVDESSMLSANLFGALLQAISCGSKLLLVGDIGQLPPVEHGAPLRDMIAAGVAYGELKEVRRNSGDGVRLCHRIRSGGSYVPSEDFGESEMSNVCHIETKSPQQALNALKSLISNAPAEFHKSRDIQVIVPLNDKGPLCRVELNKAIREIVNPEIEKDENGLPFRVNDKVMCQKNTQLESIDDEGNVIEPCEFVANGEIGEVTEIWKDGDGRHMVVAIESPPRSVLVHGDKMIYFDLAYAITVHKSQGSEWSIVIYIIDETPSARRVCCNELVYTALSRFSKAMFTIGKKSTMNTDILRRSLPLRKTFLAERLKEQLPCETQSYCHTQS
jgi:exodeoxyribonuclease V alpha subunit